MKINNIGLSKINFRGYEGYVVESRIKSDEKRDDLFYYHLRHDDDWSEPVSLEDYVFVNHWGTMCFKESIDHLLTPWGEPNEEGKRRLETELTEEEVSAIWFAINEGEEEFVKHMDI